MHRPIRAALALLALGVILAVTACSSTTPDTNSATTPAASDTANSADAAAPDDSASGAIIGTPVPVEWANGAEGTITISAAEWETTTPEGATAPSRGARLIATVDVTATSGTGAVDPYDWIATQADGQTVTAGLETAMRDGGMQAAPIDAEHPAHGLIVWDLSPVGTTTVTVSEGLAAPVTWTMPAAS